VTRLACEGSVSGLEIGKFAYLIILHSALTSQDGAEVSEKPWNVIPDRMWRAAKTKRGALFQRATQPNTIRVLQHRKQVASRADVFLLSETSTAFHEDACHQANSGATWKIGSMS